MISISEITPIGTLLKPHGIKGEIVMHLEYDIDPEKLECIILEDEGIFVPFFIDFCRPRSSESILVHIDGIDSESDAKELCQKTVYVRKSELDLQDADTEGFYISDLIDYEIIDENGVAIGRITDFDDSTSNTLLIAERETDNKTIRLFIPIADEFVIDIDRENRRIEMRLPEGLLDLN